MDFETFRAEWANKEKSELLQGLYGWVTAAHMVKSAYESAESKAEKLAAVGSFMQGFIERHGLAETFKAEAAQDVALQRHYKTHAEQWRDDKSLVAAALAENGRLSAVAALAPGRDALKKGRSAGAKVTQENSKAKKGRIEAAVDAMFLRPGDPINQNGLLVTEATAGQIARKVQGVTGLQGYAESTFLKIVGTRVAHCRSLRREQNV